MNILSHTYQRMKAIMDNNNLYAPTGTVHAITRDPKGQWWIVRNGEGPEGPQPERTPTDMATAVKMLRDRKRDALATVREVDRVLNALDAEELERQAEADDYAATVRSVTPYAVL